LCAQMFGQSSHDVVKPLTHQHDFGSRADQQLELPDALLLEDGLQLVLEIFLAQKVEAVATDSAKHGMDHASRRLAVQSVEERPQQRHQQYRPAAQPALVESLRIPCEE